MGSGIKTFGQVLAGVRYVERPGAYAFIMNEKREIAVVQTSFGYFLPGGGLDLGEDELTGLQRELREEIGFEIVTATFLMRAAQYHWSEFYQSHFKKIGAFFDVEATAPEADSCAHGHALLWMPVERAPADLSQEFQRWAAEEYIRLNPAP